MDRSLRTLHLVLGLFAGPFLLVYGISAVQMAHSDWFSITERTSFSRVTIQPAEAPGPRVLANLLMRRGVVRGELRDVTSTPDGFAFTIYRPGTQQRVDYSAAKSSASIQTRTSTFLFLLNRLHHIAGFGNGYAPLNLWSVSMAVMSIILLALSATGVYLWIHEHRDLRIGAILLILSVAIGVPLIVWMRLA